MALDLARINRANYLIVKGDLYSHREQCILFGLHIPIKKVLDVVVKTSIVIPVSCGEVQLDVDAHAVTCYGAPGAPMRHRESDSIIVERFLFGDHGNA